MTNDSEQLTWLERQTLKANLRTHNDRRMGSTAVGHLGMGIALLCWGPE